MSDGLRTKLRGRSAVYGGWTSIAHSTITEIMSRSGVDFIGIDIEHSTISLEDSRQIIAAAQAAGISCLPRVGSHNPEFIKRLLDAGADGVIVPMVNTREEADAIVRCAKFPPVGARSYGVARAHGYGFDFADYTANWNERGALILQIESIGGVNNVDAILENENVDGIMMGPYDLSGSLGIPGQLYHPDVTKACARVIDACRKKGRACGTHIIEPTPENVSAAFQEGYTFVVLSSDVFLLWKWAERMKGLIQGAPQTAKK